MPKWYAIIRSEAAVFWDEPFFKNYGATHLLGPVLDNGRITPGYRQVGVDPTGSPLLAYENDIAHSHVVRWVLGIDINRYIRALNPQQSFIISGQMFGTHIVDFNDTSPAKGRAIRLRSFCDSGQRAGQPEPIPGQYRPTPVYEHPEYLNLLPLRGD